MTQLRPFDASDRPDRMLAPGTHILEMINCLRPGGGEGQLVLLCRALLARGVKPHIGTFDPSGWHFSDLQALGVPVLEIPLRGSLLRPNTAVQVMRLARYLRAHRIAVVHAHDLYSNYIAALAARVADIPVVVSRLDMAHWFGGIRRQVMARVQRRASAVFVNAQAICDMLEREEGLAREQMALIPNGIDLAAFDREAALAPEPPLEIGPLAVIMVANMQHPVKGQRDLLFATAEVVRRHPQVELLLVGDGPLRPGYEQLAGQLGIARHVRFVGRRRDVPRLLKRAALAVSASHAEGLSNSVIEAMAAELPVVATDAGGNVELVASGRTGQLVPVGQPALMAARISELLGDELGRRAMGHAARQFVEQHLTADRMGDAFSRLYAHLVAHHHRPEGRYPLPEPAPLVARGTSSLPTTPGARSGEAAGLGSPHGAAA